MDFQTGLENNEPLNEDLETESQFDLFSSGSYKTEFFDLFENSVVADLPKPPNPKILFELLDIYFMKVLPMKSIIHPAKFKFDFINYFNAPVKECDHLPLFVRCLIAPPISPALVLSMMACSAYYHPAFNKDEGLIRQTFFERARRLLLEVND
jgi:hypothetical protein